MTKHSNAPGEAMAGLFGPKTRFAKRVPDGDNLERLVCDTCDYVHYVNPKMVVGAVVTDDQGRILMCKRAIEPRKGFWTLPAGFMEEQETTAQGAMREAQEEACADIQTGDMLAVYDLPHISQIQIMYKADLLSPDIAPGPESEEVAMVHWDDIPWREIAFPSVKWVLEFWKGLDGKPVGAPDRSPPQYFAFLEKMKADSKAGT